VAGVLCAGGVRLHQRGTRARYHSSILASISGLHHGDGATREIDCAFKLTTMSLAPTRQVQRGRLSKLFSENDRSRARKSVRIERCRKVRGRRHGLSLSKEG
jgi:hypothetical protein